MLLHSHPLSAVERNVAASPLDVKVRPTNECYSFMLPEQRCDNSQCHEASGATQYSKNL